ncbi:hypothetical protein TSOC_005525 [Tetrabaena socialis]|uniref:phytol kinase n=1 Tax=Tetrabaena socialis TaxID=47790 RepID=A0A2J8A629_9CHLO|nr:hypothetical protein TSOC_005525 [Tetrabaena socialis]|eukprot:PNH07968.1 hypothetical protein TSOC_005525 [Tetrabaena socialis]
MYATQIVTALAFKLHGWKGLSATTQAACVQRLLPTGLLRSVDCLLRHLAAAGLRSEDDLDTVSSCLSLLASSALTSVLRAHVAAAPACGSGHGGSVGRPQGDLGLLVSAAKLARRGAEVEQPGGVALVLRPNLLVATGLARVGQDMMTLLADLTQQRRRGSSSPATVEQSAEAEVVLREVIALVSVAVLPTLERVAVRDLRSPGGPGGGGGSGGGRGGGGGGRGRSSASGVRGGGGGVGLMEQLFLGNQSHADMMSTLTCSIAQDCRAGTIETMIHCLAAAVQLLPSGDLLALQPQRAMALLGLLLQRAHELRRPGAGRGSHGGGRGGGDGRGTSDGVRSQEDALPAWADEVAGVLVHMAADEQLVGAVAGWLRGEAAALAQPAQAGALVVPPQGLCGDLDARALAAAVRHWNAAAADSIDRLHAAAASSAPAAGGEGECGGGSSSSRSSAAAASGGGSTAPLLAAARAAIDLRHETALWGLRDGGAGGYPSWPPRVLRLCGNPACRNFAGPAEADLPLRKCARCEAVRYCGAGCQGQHWREGGHREACARLRAATQAVRGGG